MRGGVLVVDKPSGPTSFDVVQEVRRALRAGKAGHTGTLDPLATGVLAVCVGEAVKLQRWLTEGDKSYQATVAFGAATDTEDAAGRVVARGDAAALSAQAIREALPHFVGIIAQRPPMYSAVRVGGRRLHEAARSGEELDRAPRDVRVDALELLSFEPGRGDLALARIVVRCGKGTYVRTLAADIGRALGVPAHLAALRRTVAGPFRIEDAIALDAVRDLARRDPEALRARLVTPEAALAFLPAVPVSAEEARALVHGKALARPGLSGGLARALGPGGGLVAVCELQGVALRPVRVLVTPRDLPGEGG